MPIALEGPVTATGSRHGAIAVKIGDQPKFWLTVEQARACADGVRAVRPVLDGSRSLIVSLHGHGQFGAERLPDGRISLRHGHLGRATVFAGAAQAEQLVAALTEALAGGAGS